MRRRSDFIALGVILAGLLLARCPSAFALNPALDVSQYAHTAWKVRDGFAKGGINAIAQTPDGYLWLGTHFGLLRFDGVKNIPWQPGDQHLPSDQIFSLLATRDGTLWIGTFSGLASWKDGTLTQYSELADRFVFKILEDHEGTVWASGVSAIPGEGRLCGIRSGKARCYGDDGSLGRGAFNLYEDRGGRLWAGVKTGLWRWRPGPPRFYPLAGEPDGIPAIGEDADGALLVGWKGGIHRFVDGKTELYSLHGSGPPFVAFRMLRDRGGSLWTATADRGLLHVHRGRTDRFSASDGLSGESVSTMFEDREGNIWVGTSNGLDRFRDFAVNTLTANQGLSTAIVGSVLADRDGSVWLGTVQGLNRWHDEHITTYDEREGKLAGFVPNSLFQDDRGRIWVSTQGAVGYLENSRFRPIRAVPGGTVLSMAQDTDGNLWVANERRGLFQVFHDRLVRLIPWDSLGRRDHASVLAADRLHGGLWIGFFLGGIVHFKDGAIRDRYSAADGLGNGRVSGFHFDSDGTLWTSTAGGLSRSRDGRVTTLTARNGLPCDAVNGVIEDDAHSLWLYMACGLVRIARSELDAWAAALNRDRDTKRIIRATVFDSLDGVRSQRDGTHYNPPVAKSVDGTLWFLPLDGVSIVDPRHLPLNGIPPPVHVERITADRRIYDLASAGDRDVRFPPLTRDLEIDYTALSLIAPEKNRFRTKLEGWDRDWQDAGNRRQAFYSNLPPRPYRFRVMASNNNGVWNETGDTFAFSIAPAYYQTTWFRAAMVVAVLALLCAAYQYRLRRFAGEFDARLQERVNERTRIARELHDTLLQTFHGVLFHFQAATNRLPESAAKQEFERAIDQAAQALTEGRDAVQNLRASTSVTNDLAEALSTLAGELAAAQVRDANVPPTVADVSAVGTSRDIHPIQRDDIYRIAGEALRNAFRHAHARRIEVEIRYGDRELQVRVRDDGKGIDPAFTDAARPGHFGLAGMRERAELAGGHLEVWSEVGLGTEVELTIPAKAAYGRARARRRFRLFGRRTQVSAERTEVSS